MPVTFTWIPLYKEIALKLVEWESRQQELIAFIEQMRADEVVVTPLKDKDKDGNPFLLDEIDPFTFLGCFNRGIRSQQRLLILAKTKKFLGATSELPYDFDGIPILNNLRSWFIPYKPKRTSNNVNHLWKIFKSALRENPLDQDSFLADLDTAFGMWGINTNLTMGLFWIRPDVFLNLDQTNSSYLNLRFPSGGLNGEFYKETIEITGKQYASFPELSLAAYKGQKLTAGIDGEVSYWIGGAYFGDREPHDQSEEFVAEGIWENGYETKLTDKVNLMKVGDKIAIKSTFTQTKDLPFDNRGNTVSCMAIKAIGTIVANRQDGRVVEVEWDQDFEPKTWYFYTYQPTLWQLNTDETHKNYEYTKRLIEFVWGDKNQDLNWFVKRWYDDSQNTNTGEVSDPYSVDDLLSSGVFLTQYEVEQMIDRLRGKKNLILQGPPGVGKTFIAKKLAYALMEFKDDSRVGFIQFHQTFSYEDFVRGYRPMPEKAGSFDLKDAVFYRFCERARANLDRDYVFIIDEINRGNLSQIFGELLMLIEADKRNEAHAVDLVYQRPDEQPFYIPPNVHIIGLMNLADRSLAIVDYALRRRFAFSTLKPSFERKLFHDWLTARGMTKTLVAKIADRMTDLNGIIEKDPLLGENYTIGHSFFCPKGDAFSSLNSKWYDSIIETEIYPLLKEYWFDDAKKANECVDRLLAP